MSNPPQDVAVACIGSQLSHVQLGDDGRQQQPQQTEQQRQHNIALEDACFKEALHAEASILASKGILVDQARKRQILADVLVWAEISQDHYSKEIQGFVLEPNKQDESFLRIGRLFHEAKQRRGLR